MILFIYHGSIVSFVFLFNVTATTECYTYVHTLSLHAALPICANRKQMPRSASVASAVAAARSRSRPSASSVSAAPALEEAARLPCLATGTPAAATTSDTEVETMSVWCPSPPVPPTRSDESRGGEGFVRTIESPRSPFQEKKK